jgi:diadenosine tetraphosphate (Ap4A) HIT family hydrolase
VADITPDELLDWLTVVKTLEAALRTAFDATLFNWSCYMNHSYRESPPDPHIHWWAVPRYNHQVQIDDWVFEDPQFGNPYDHNRWIKVPPEIHRKIAEEIRRAIA